MPAYAADDESITFLYINPSTLGQSIVNTATVGSASSERLPEKNVLYLPANCDITYLRYSANFSESRPSATELEATTASSPTENDESMLVKRPLVSNFMQLLERGALDADGTALRIDDNIISVNELVENVETNAYVSGAVNTLGGTVIATEAADALAPQSDTIQTNPMSSTGTIDLTNIEQETDADGQAYWHLIFTNTSSYLHVYVYQTMGIPTMFVKTSKGLPWIQESKENIDGAASITMVSADGLSTIYTSESNEIKTRGNSTWTFSKKPYQIKLAAKTELIPGAGKAKTWILLANVLDESLIRNRISYNLAAASGLAYSPACMPVDLFIDGRYEGSYLLSEKIQIASNRVEIFNLEDANKEVNPGVDIDAASPVVITNTVETMFSHVNEASYTNIKSPKDITGGYLLEMELLSRYQTEPSYFLTSNQTAFVIKEPERASENEVAYISMFMQELEDAIYSPSGYNSKGKHFSEYIDMDSFARYYAIQEVLANYDGFVSSTYFYKDRDENGVKGKLYAGPIWDCDHVLLATALDVNYAAIDQLFIGNAARGTETTKWISQLMSHPEFIAAVRDAYISDVNPQILSMLSGDIDEYAESIDKSAAIDNVRWSARKMSGEFPYKDANELSFITDLGRHETSIATVKDFLSRRALSLCAMPQLGSYELAEMYHTISVDESLIGHVEATRDYALANERVAVRIPSGKELHLCIEFFRNGQLCSLPVSVTDETGIQVFTMPSSDVCIKIDSSVTLGSIDAIAAQAYTGKAITPRTIVRDEAGNVLVEGKDYSLAFQRNTEIGTGFALATGKGAYSGTLSAGFRIIKTPSWTRLAGADRYLTAQRIIREGFETGFAATVLLASGEDFPDALSAAALAGMYHAPVLLTTNEALAPSTREEIVRLGATKVIIIGGTGAVSSNVEQQVKEISSTMKVERVFGANRSGTAIAVFEKGKQLASWNSSSTAIIANGYSFADALSISPYAYAKSAPIFLTEYNGFLSNETIAAVKSGGFSRIILVGGTGVVDDYVKNQLGLNLSYVRLGKEDRFQTSDAIAKWSIGEGLSSDGIAVATGIDFPDALAGASLCGTRGSVLVLACDEQTGLYCVNNLIAHSKGDITRGFLLGGEGAISVALANKIFIATGL